MVIKKRSLVITGAVVGALVVLYGGVFYYQHMRAGQKVDIPEQVATTTQTQTSADDTAEATSTLNTPISTASCRVSGCSGEICAEGNLVSTCIYKAEYACYKTATCERQSTGTCGWTNTPELLACVEGKQGGSDTILPQ